MEDIRFTINQVRTQKAGVIIGKNRVGVGTINSIKDYIKKHALLKIKILKSALSIDYTLENIINDIVTNTNFYVIDKRGNTVIVSSSPIKK